MTVDLVPVDPTSVSTPAPLPPHPQVDDTDKSAFTHMLHELLRTRFDVREDHDELFVRQTVVFGDFARPGAASEDRVYEEVVDPGKLLQVGRGGGVRVVEVEVEAGGWWKWKWSVMPRAGMRAGGGSRGGGEGGIGGGRRCVRTINLSGGSHTFTVLSVFFHASP